ncbi:hypothetical protein IEQ34_014726 [Dendrobium chrysotoxum]|uniref:Uncharacterized protein n=1 Tax=Dendrobium chrysotoxum TaxID=161865 RepID=A0AAV7GM83_DENCH|nr:hypothetical protein IEQ34_014726 [Dendrobium chrysotoxum]
MLITQHYFGAGHESDTKSRQILNTRYDPKQGSRSASETMGDKLHRREGNSLDHQLRPLNDRSMIKEPGGLRNLPDKEFRYLRTIIVTAAVHRGFGRRLPCQHVTNCLPGPIIVSKGPIYIHY